ncbi:MAG: endopeptidase La [Acutalibacteraceae bacterium]|nr:endopeptidase La [Acutalibacteraceae bacterium]
MSLLNSQQSKIMPLLALRGLVAFPNMPIHFEVGRTASIIALNKSMDKDQLIFLVSQKDLRDEEPEVEALYEIGCVARIRQFLRLSEKTVKVVCECLYRAQRVNAKKSDGCYIAEIHLVSDTASHHTEKYTEAIIRKIHDEFEKYALLLPTGVSTEVMMNVATSDDLTELCHYIASNIPAPFDDKQFILEQLEPYTRAKMLLKLLSKECGLLKIDNKISESVRVQIDDNQREYYLKEQMKAISEELYGDSYDDTEDYYNRIALLNASMSVKEKLSAEVGKLSKMPPGSQESAVIRNYLDECLSLPWDTSTPTKNDLKRSSKILEKDFYGMKQVKERILEMLSVYSLVSDISGQIICLYGPPGVGKTSIAKSIAECMGRNYARIALGGINDEAEIRGHRKTYVGAMAGKIISAIKQAKSNNPLILLDEIDKLSTNYKGDPASALLEVLDPEQNSTFTDHYIDLPFDLSKVVFITTANSLDTIPSPLRDRLEIIELSSYTREEKFNIAKKHLLKKQLTRHGLTASMCKITDKALYDLIDFYTREAGVRALERKIATLCRKTAKEIVENQIKSIKIDSDKVTEMLGRHRYRPEEILNDNEVGVINGLAWTAVGGELMQIEVSAVPGTGKLELTGSLGDVMKESAHAALTYVRSRADHLGIDSDFYKTKDIHIHATESAIPKDGPSAGVTMTTALVSALTDKPVRRDIAMTGEISIRGRVLPIGGLREKSIAAYRSGVKTVFIPKDNLADLDDVDQIVKDHLEFIPVGSQDEILDKALIQP